MKTSHTLTLTALTCLTLTSCATNTTPPPTTSLTIFAAASLRGAFTDIAALHDQRHHTTTAISFGSSHALALAVAEGTPADVLATADTAAMDVAGISQWTPLATNSLAVAVAEGNPLGINDVADVEQVDVAQCVQSAPCGILAHQFAHSAGITPRVVTQGTDVTHTLSALTTGQVDVALVYTTDVYATAGVEAVELEDATLPSTTYAIADLNDSGAGSDFVDTVMSDAGQDIMEKHGFSTQGRDE